MKIILKQDIQSLGFANDVVEVKNGYARNYLIPQGLAVAATSSALKVHQENMRQQAHKAEKMLDEAKSLAERIAGVKIKVGAKLGESGKIFGSINTVMLAQALSAEGIPVERRRLKLADESIRELGTYKASALLHKEVSADFEFEVVAE